MKTKHLLFVLLLLIVGTHISRAADWVLFEDKYNAAHYTALTIDAGGVTEVYVALLPTTDSRTYNFTVTSGSSIYTGTASALLKKGEYVVATGLKLTHQQ
ncbi:MAG: hypothetical protein IJS49_07505 [Paludibacteraceae bacterium]|nr:hypothetical protein [Paludibacteraceae bacterium]